MKTGTFGADNDPEWVEHIFQTQIVAFCSVNPNSNDHSVAQLAFKKCLERGLAPRATLNLLKSKVEALRKKYLIENLPTAATYACLNYLKSQIDLLEINTPPSQQQQFSHRLIITGTSKDLDAIYDGIEALIGGYQCEIEREAIPPAEMTTEQTDKILGGEVLTFGTSRVVISSNTIGDVLKPIISKKFPRVKFE